MKTIEQGDLLQYPDGELYVVTSTSNGIHGFRATEEELADGENLGGRDRLYLGADMTELERQGVQVVELE